MINIIPDNATNPNSITVADLAPFLPAGCYFGRGKPMHFVITCHQFDDLAKAIEYAQRVPQDEFTSVNIKTIQERC